MNKLKEFYNTLEEINQPYFEEQKVRTLLDHIMCPADQIKSCVHTSRKDFKVDFAGACTYLSSEIARILPEEDPGFQKYMTSGRDTSKTRGNRRRVAADTSGGCQNNKGRKENGVDISNTSWYYSTD